MEDDMPLEVDLEAGFNDEETEVFMSHELKQIPGSESFEESTETDSISETFLHSETENTSHHGIPPPRPFPAFQVALVCFMLLSDAFSITVLLPFSNQQIAFFGVTEVTEEIGYYSGYIASIFNFTQLFSNLLWGWMTDLGVFGQVERARGRKVTGYKRWFLWCEKRRVLQIGCAASCLSLFIIGFSRFYWQSVIARIIWGVFNTNFPVAKSYLNEVTDSTTRAKAFSAISLVWGLGSILGPVAGGFLSDVILVDSFPYALPCLVSCALTITAIIISFIWLEEPIPKILDLEPHKNVEMQVVEKSAKGNEEFVEVPIIDTNVLFQHKYSSNAAIRVLQSIKYFVLDNSHFLMTCAMFGIIGFCTIGVDELFPLWSITSYESGGLDWNEDDIGTAWAITGAFVIIFNLFFYQKITKKIGQLWNVRISAFISLFIFPLYPILHFFVPLSPFIFWSVISFFSMIRASVGTLLYVSTNVLFINTAKIPMGVVNGMGGSILCLAKAIAPALLTNMFAWSTTSGHHFPLNHWFAFIFNGLTPILILIFSLHIPASAGFFAFSDKTHPIK